MAIFGVDWTQSKGVLIVDFCHVAPGAHSLYHVNGMVKRRVPYVEVFAGDAVIDCRSLWK